MDIGRCTNLSFIRSFHCSSSQSLGETEEENNSTDADNDAIIGSINVLAELDPSNEYAGADPGFYEKTGLFCIRSI